MTKVLWAGMDLHSNNVMIGIIDQDGRRLKSTKLPCHLETIVKFLKPYKSRLKGLTVESTFNWYWLVDGLMKLDYPVVLANPAKIEPYNGVKHADDRHDAFFLAELQRLNILPTGYIYDAELRPVRDLLRRRLSLVQQRTALMLSFKSLYARTTGETLMLSRVKAMTEEEAGALYEHPANRLIATVQKEHIGKLSLSVQRIEKLVLSRAQKLPCYDQITTLPGVGKILGMTITMEVGEVSRFKQPGDFASYCRAVDSRRLSNEKTKGWNNRKCGNKYLGWAFVEAANFAKRNDPECRRWFDRKAARKGTVLATKALACKLAKAAWYIMSKGQAFNEELFFGRAADSQGKGLAKSSED